MGIEVRLNDKFMYLVHACVVVCNTLLIVYERARSCMRTCDRARVSVYELVCVGCTGAHVHVCARRM